MLDRALKPSGTNRSIAATTFQTDMSRKASSGEGSSSPSASIVEKVVTAAKVVTIVLIPNSIVMASIGFDYCIYLIYRFYIFNTIMNPNCIHLVVAKRFVLSYFFHPLEEELFPVEHLDEPN